MLNWNVINKTYVYDGTFEGILSMAFDCYIKKIIPFKIISKNNLEINFLDTIQDVKTDIVKAKRIFDGIHKNISYDTLYNSYYAFLSDGKEKELNILKYILNGFVIGPKINTMLSLDFVFAVCSMRKRMLGEAHRFKRFTSFF